uniref:Neuronal cell adhesion molecule n=1 Tax=Echeneis naucrates TaxID=173247 RepID=A0A665X4B5_ECHNA
MEAALLALIVGHLVTALEVPLDLPQPPTITHQSPKDYIVDPRENIIIHCEAKGKPHPSFSWTRNGIHFDIDSYPNVVMRPHSGTLVVDISREKADHYEGEYQCTARNKHGTAISHNIVVRQSSECRTAKHNILLYLHCPTIMYISHRRLPQSSRVSQSLNGDLYFSNVLQEDSRNDYICYARFPHTQTIQQKQPITVRVLNPLFHHVDLFLVGFVDERKPTFLIPSGPSSSKMVLRGQVLEMECIAEGLPTPELSWTKVSGDLPAKRTSFLHYQKWLRIVNVSESDAGDYRCTARNRHGTVHHTIHVTVKAAPYWISGAPRNLVLAPGENGVLTCRASGTPKPLVMWAMNGIPIENSPKDVSRKVEDDTIIFTDVQTGSSAVYQCNVSNEYGYLLANAFVNVLSEPARVLTPANKVYQFIRNSRALIDCASFGSPIPKITWFKDSRSSTLDGEPYIFHDNGTLEIPIVQARNGGKYTCVARNTLGIYENHVYLEVKEPTRIVKQPEYKMVQRGRSVVFQCKVKHDPSLILNTMWLKDDEELPDDDSLTITDVTESDAGMYTCITNTSLDHDSASAELTVVGISRCSCYFNLPPEKPDPPTDLELTDKKKKSVQLTWIPGDEHNSPIQKFLIQYEDSLHHRGHWHNLTEVPGTTTTTYLKLSPYVHYTFRVLAYNDVGFSRPSAPSRMYKTEPAAPDENPAGVKGFGTEHDNLVISWKPLTSLQSNGPGLQYRVMWRQKAVENQWTKVTVANTTKFVVSGTPTFVPYELKVQAVNDHGDGPEPAIAHGFSGEDLPAAAPENVQAVVLNSTLAEVHWDPVSHRLIRGHLKGYKVYYWRERSLHKHNPHHMEKLILTFSGNRSHGLLPGLHSFSLYSFNVRVYNGKGEGPPSPTQQFETPEGVPGIPTSLVVTNSNSDSLTLEWSPPHDRNGHITGYTLKYQPGEASKVMNCNSGPHRQVDIATQGWFIGLMCAIALLILILLIICFIQRNKGGKYPGELLLKNHYDCTFGEYSDNEDHKPLKGSRTPSNGTVKRDDSDDSLVDYGEGGDGQFNEDGSFIGQYSGKSSSRDNAEGHESSEAPSPINAMNSLNSFV